MWNEVTLQCRGFIINKDTEEIVARPFPKFFNRHEPDAPVFPPMTPVEVTDKADGSLGILYRTPEGSAISTRGSFTSDQAIHATYLLNTKYADVDFGNRATYLFEIVYPENRIVIDYNDLDDLILLGSVGMDTGTSLGPEIAKKVINWQGPVTETFNYSTWAEALAAPERPRCEGIVIRSLEHDIRVKLKQDDYVALHKIVTGLNARVVWSYIKDAKPLQELLEPLPDEFRPWVEDVARRLELEHVSRLSLLDSGWRGIKKNLDEDYSRKEFAEFVFKHPWTKENSWAMFALEDGKDISTKMWDILKPEGNLTPSRNFNG